MSWLVALKMLGRLAGAMIAIVGRGKGGRLEGRNSWSAGCRRLYKRMLSLELQIILHSSRKKSVGKPKSSAPLRPYNLKG